MLPDVVLRRFENPDEVREMTNGRFEIVRVGGVTIGRATYQPGWRWSQHVGPSVGATHCTVEHVGLVLAGVATVAFDDGRQAAPDILIPPLEAKHFAVPGHGFLYVTDRKGDVINAFKEKSGAFDCSHTNVSVAEAPPARRTPYDERCLPRNPSIFGLWPRVLGLTRSA